MAEQLDPPDEWSFEIDLDAFEKSFARSIAYVRENHGNAIALQEDWFWSIPREDLFDISRDEPIEPTIGSLADAWEFISKTDPGEEVNLGLRWFAQIIDALSQLPDKSSPKG